MKDVRKPTENDSGQSIVEYAAALALVAVVVIASLSALGVKISGTVENTASALPGGDTQSDPVLYVAGIELSVNPGGQVRVTASVTVFDEDGDGVRRATVSASWYVNGTLVETDSDGADGRGRARFTYRSRDLEQGDVVMLTVTNVSASGYEYDSGSNAETSDDILVP